MTTQPTGEVTMGLQEGQIWSFEEPGQRPVLVEIIRLEDGKVECGDRSGTLFSWSAEHFGKFGKHIKDTSLIGFFSCGCGHARSQHAFDESDTPPCRVDDCSCEQYTRSGFLAANAAR